MTGESTGLWLADKPLVLASRSASRQAVLAGAGIPLDILPADIDERAVEADSGTLSPSAVATLLARQKACAVAAQRPGRLVLGADQTLALGDRIFWKPADVAAARDQLRSLRGRTHTLHSGIVLVRDGDILYEHCETAGLTMRDFSDGFLESYLATVGLAVTASVGAYQVEGAGIHLFEHIDGDHFTILGLPLLGLLGYLRRQGCLAY
jgi:nucleoside triphosphate pyrophosphatase